jgi:hypothetical protein
LKLQPQPHLSAKAAVPSDVASSTVLYFLLAYGRICSHTAALTQNAAVMYTDKIKGMFQRDKHAEHSPELENMT